MLDQISVPSSSIQTVGQNSEFVINLDLGRFDRIQFSDDCVFVRERECYDIGEIFTCFKCSYCGYKCNYNPDSKMKYCPYCGRKIGVIKSHD